MLHFSEQYEPSFGASIPIENSFIGCKNGTFMVKELGACARSGYYNQNLGINTAFDDVQAVFEEELHITVLRDIQNLEMIHVNVASQVLIRAHDSETNNPKR